MCGEVEENDFGWMNGVLCHDASDAIKSTPSIVAECSPGPGPCVLNGWQDSKRVPPSTQYEFSRA